MSLNCPGHYTASTELKETSRRYMCLHQALNDCALVPGYRCVSFRQKPNTSMQAGTEGSKGPEEITPKEKRGWKRWHGSFAVKAALGSQQSSSCCPHLQTRPCGGPAATSLSQKAFPPEVSSSHLLSISLFRKVFQWKEQWWVKPWYSFYDGKTKVQRAEVV